jgi:hypothetical protein
MTRTPWLFGLIAAVALTIAPMAQAVMPVPPPAAATPALKARLTAAAGAVPPTNDANAELKHPVLVLDLGVLGPAALALYSSGGQSTYSGAVVTAPNGPTGPLKISPLPPMNEIEGRFELTPTAVFTTDIAGARALVVLYDYYINGSGQDEGHAGYVYAWTGGGWAIDEKRSHALAGVRNAKTARAKLATVR